MCCEHHNSLLQMCPWGLEMGALDAAGGPWLMGLPARGERALEWALWLPVELVGPAFDAERTRGCLIS